MHGTMARLKKAHPSIQPGETLRYTLTPSPSGTRWYHIHAMAMDDLAVAGYSGQFGFLLVEGTLDPGHYDQEVHLAVHHWGGHFVPMVETMRIARKMCRRQQARTWATPTRR